MKNNYKVYLRALELDDYKKSIHWRKNEEIWSMVAGPKYFVSEAYEKKWVEESIFSSSSNLSLAICLKENDEHIGYVYLNDINWQNRSAKTAKLIGEKKYWGKGIGTEVTLLILEHSFEVLGLERIESRQLSDNIGSIKALEKCGYKSEGVLRRAAFKNGEFQDLNLMSVLKEDYFWNEEIIINGKKGIYMEGFSKVINVTKPLVPEVFSASNMVKEVIESSWLTNNGPKHQVLEQQLLDYLDIENLSLFSNGTMALLLGLNALGIKGEVITTPFTFPATLEVLDWNGLTPVFCDIDPETFNINPDKIEELITERTTAILAVHVFGNPCDVFKIQEIADRHNLKVVYDGAHAFGMEVEGKPSGQFGDITMFSFHATKLFNTIEGGGLAFKEASLKKELNLLKNFGIEGQERVVKSGLNAKLNEIQAGFGSEVLRIVHHERLKRHQVKKVYDEILGPIEGIRIVTNREGKESSYQYFVIEIDEKEFGYSRDQLHKLLKEYNIFTRKYFYPLCSSFEWYESLESATEENLPVAHITVEKVLALPFYGDLSIDEARQICNIIVNIKEKKSTRSEQ